MEIALEPQIQIESNGKIYRTIILSNSSKTKILDFQITSNYNEFIEINPPSGKVSSVESVKVIIQIQIVKGMKKVPRVRIFFKLLSDDWKIKFKYFEIKLLLNKDLMGISRLATVDHFLEDSIIIRHANDNLMEIKGNNFKLFAHRAQSDKVNMNINIVFSVY